MTDFFHITIVPKYHVGDPAPAGYVQWHEWARVQIRGGLRQVRCEKCELLKFPQELAGAVCTECFFDSLRGSEA